MSDQAAVILTTDPDIETHRVYFLYCAGFIKIGVTKGLIRRLKEIQVGTPFPAQAVLLLRGGKLTEEYMHHLFREYHHHGEWFTLGTKLRELIVSHAPAYCIQWLEEEEAVHMAWITEQATKL